MRYDKNRCVINLLLMKNIEEGALIDIIFNVASIYMIYNKPVNNEIYDTYEVRSILRSTLIYIKYFTSYMCTYTLLFFTMYNTRKNLKSSKCKHTHTHTTDKYSLRA